MWHASSSTSHAGTPDGIFRDDVIQIHTFSHASHSVYMHIHCGCMLTHKHSGGAPLSPAPAWRSPCRSSRQRLTGHSTGCISPSWLRSSSLRLFHPWSPLEAPGHALSPSVHPRSSHCRNWSVLSLFHWSQRHPRSAPASSLSLLNVSISLSLPLWLSIYLSHSVPLPLTLTLALAMLHSAGRDYLIALGWKQWMGGGTEGEREGCRKREMLAGTETPPTPSSRAPNNAGGRETERERGMWRTRIQHLLKGIFPFIPGLKDCKRKAGGGQSVYRHSPSCTYTLPHPLSCTSRENS